MFVRTVDTRWSLSLNFYHEMRMRGVHATSLAFTDTINPVYRTGTSSITSGLSSTCLAGVDMDGSQFQQSEISR